MKSTEISIPIGEYSLKGNLNSPANANCLIVFSHGSNSSRFSKRNSYVAKFFNKSKMATLLVDLLTEQENEIFENRFNIDLLTGRLIIITNYVAKLTELKKLPIGYFGSSTGVASALKATLGLKNSIKSIVSMGGRPDLANSDLQYINVPTLLIVGSLDTVVIELNQYAFLALNCDKRLEIIEGATHLSEETDKLDEVANLAKDWFAKSMFTRKTKSHIVHK
jgi:hypothetical protein